MTSKYSQIEKNSDYCKNLNFSTAQHLIPFSYYAALLFKRLRFEKKLSQLQLSMRANVSVSYISALENGNNFFNTWLSLDRLCKTMTSTYNVFLDNSTEFYKLHLFYQQCSPLIQAKSSKKMRDLHQYLNSKTPQTHKNINKIPQANPYNFPNSPY